MILKFELERKTMMSKINRDKGRVQALYRLNEAKQGEARLGIRRISPVRHKTFKLKFIKFFRILIKF